MLYTILFIPPILYALSNLIDKHLAHEDTDSNPETLLVIGGFFNLCVALIFIIYFFIINKPVGVNYALFLNGAIFSIAIWIYLKILFKYDVEKVAPWYQTIPVFGLIGGAIFLSEYPTLIQIVGIFLIIFGGFFLAKQGVKVNYRIIFGMLISSLLIALNDVVLAYFGRPLSTSDVLFSDVLGKAFFCCIPLLNYTIIKKVKSSFKSKISFQSLNETIFILGDLILDYAKLILPVVLVQVFASTQPLFLLVGVYITSKYWPNFLRQGNSLKNMKINLIFILLIVIGGILIFI